jgi:hypothetical protein
MSYDNEKKFALFKNDKGDNPKRPDYRGEITVNGVKYRMSAWISTDKQGRKYMRGDISVDERAAPSAPPTPKAEYASYTPGPAASVPPAPKPVQRDLTGAPIDDESNVPF